MKKHALTLGLLALVGLVGPTYASGVSVATTGFGGSVAVVNSTPVLNFLAVPTQTVFVPTFSTFAVSAPVCHTGFGFAGPVGYGGNVGFGYGGAVGFNRGFGFGGPVGFNGGFGGGTAVAVGGRGNVSVASPGVAVAVSRGGLFGFRRNVAVAVGR